MSVRRKPLTFDRDALLNPFRPPLSTDSGGLIIFSLCATIAPGPCSLSTTSGGEKVRGIILAGGAGTRLLPATRVVSKQLLPIGGKPMVYYPLSLLLLAGIRDMLVITTAEMQILFQRLLGDGSQWGVHFTYAIQEEPRGLADAFLIGRDFIGCDSVCLVLGDNILFGHGVTETLRMAAAQESGATIFAYEVRHPERYGVVVFDPKDGRAVKLIEKPQESESRFAVPGLYFYDHTVVSRADRLQPSLRGELEIVDLNTTYLQEGMLHVLPLGRGVLWLDAGDHDEYVSANSIVRALEERQGMLIGSPEEIAFRTNRIDREQLLSLTAGLGETPYAQYLKQLATESEMVLREEVWMGNI